MLDKPAREGWTVDTAMAHLLSLLADAEKRNEARFKAAEQTVNLQFGAQRDAVNTAMASADRAVQKAETAAEKRFESVNEFRNTLADQQRNLMPRSEVTVMMSAMQEKINALEKTIDGMHAERLGMRGGWGYAVGVVGFVLTVVTLIGVAVASLKP